MPSIAVLKQLVRERTSRKDAFRQPEPDLVMEDAAHVTAFHEAGKEHGVMAPVYLFHAAHVSEIVRPGDTVLDLGCGPANQLSLIARLNPDVHFTGVDLSQEMLTRASDNLAAQGIRNVELQHGDITKLSSFDACSVDAIISTVVLHHLPNEDSLFSCFSEVSRVLKPGGGLYLADFGHLKTEAAIRYFAHRYEDIQPVLYTADYLNSLRAAFEFATWRAAWSRHLHDFGMLYSTFLMPHMVAAKSPTQRALPGELLDRLKAIFQAMPDYHRTDLKDLATFFRLGGLRSPKFW